MYFVGVDIAKEFHVITVLGADGKIVKKAFEVKSNIEEFKNLLWVLKDITNDKSKFTIGMEVTGLLYENLYEFLSNNSYKVKLLNPYQTSRYREMITMKLVKNDNIDSLVIAKMLKSDDYSSAYVSENLYANLKILNRDRDNLMQDLKSIKRRLQTMLNVVFPEFSRIFKDPCSISALALLEKYPTAKDYKHSSSERVLKVFRNIKGNNFNKEKAEKLLELAKNSTYSGKDREARSLVINRYIRMIRNYQSEIDLIDKDIASLLNPEDKEKNPQIRVFENLKTIPGVSDKTIVSILSECGDLRRFENSKKFIGYLGLYPTMNQSGNSKSVGRLAKRGSNIAKKALYLASVASIRHNSELKQIYQNKRSAGKSVKQALIVVARKLALIIYSIFKNNTNYNANRVFICST